MTITLTREEAQQVLDAMNSVAIEEHLCNAAHHPKKDRHGINDPCPVAKRFNKAVETLRARLAQPEPDEIKWDASAPLVMNPHPAFAKSQREWQGLTDEDIAEMHYEIKVKGMGAYKTEDIYRAIEAKLREKNT